MKTHCWKLCSECDDINVAKWKYLTSLCAWMLFDSMKCVKIQTFIGMDMIFFLHLHELFCTAKMWKKMPFHRLEFIADCYFRMNMWHSWNFVHNDLLQRCKHKWKSPSKWFSIYMRTFSIIMYAEIMYVNVPVAVMSCHVMKQSYYFCRHISISRIQFQFDKVFASSNENA